MHFLAKRLFHCNHPVTSYPERLQRLRLSVAVFCLSLLIALTAFLLFALSQIESNQRAEYQREAMSFIESANKRLARKRMLINAVPVDAFDYYREIYNPVTGKTQQELSPLSELSYQQPKLSPQVTGLVGFFQLTDKGEFNSPVWPGVINNPQTSMPSPQIVLTDEEDAELALRKQTAENLYDIVSSAASIQALLADKLADNAPLFKMVFDSPEHFIFYRLVFHAQQKLLQGFVVERSRYFSELLADVMEDMRFDIPVLVTVANTLNSSQTEYFVYQNNNPDPEQNAQNQVSKLSTPETHLIQTPLYASSMAWPYDNINVTFTTDALPITDAKLYSAVFVLLVILAVVICCFGFYRLGVKQLQLAEQRLNFVSSVSHELKTPLTSIRMYSEMLKQGTVMSQPHKQEYYEFIFAESQRLSRLINNVLQLAALNHQQHNLQPKFTPVTVIKDLIRSKTSSVIEKHGFVQHFVMGLEREDSVLMAVDNDAFSQIIINITDNTIKFFDKNKIKDPKRQRIDFVFSQAPSSEHEIQLQIRDYGEGITPEQEDKIFELFYRGRSELTRTTQGTGIGLALVHELILAQQGKVRVARKNPGLCIVLTFKAKYANVQH